MISIEVLRLIEYCFYILNCVIKCSSTVLYDAWYMLRYFCLTSYNLMLYPTQVFGYFQKDQCKL